MRLVGAVLVLLLAAVPAAAQNDDASSRHGVTASPAGSTSKFRKPSPARAAAMKARAAARNARAAAQQQSSEGGATRNGPSAARLAAAARKRGATQPNAAKDRSAALPSNELTIIQSELAWVGEYTGPINGEPDDKITAAIKSFQRNRKFKETGVLNTQERALLAAAAKAKQSQVGWRIIDDPVTGARLGIPTQADAEQVEGQDRDALGVRAGAGPGRDLPHPGARHDAGGRVRTAEEGAGEPQDRDQPAEARTVRPDRHAGAEEISRPRRDQGRRGAGHDRASRSGDRNHHGSRSSSSWRTRSRRFPASPASCRLADRRPSARSNTAPASS